MRRFALPPIAVAQSAHLPPTHCYRAHPRLQWFSLVYQMLWRSRARSRSGGAPNKRLYSRLNCDGLSYPTR